MLRITGQDNLDWCMLNTGAYPWKKVNIQDIFGKYFTPIKSDFNFSLCIWLQSKDFLRFSHPYKIFYLHFFVKVDSSVNQVTLGLCNVFSIIENLVMMYWIWYMYSTPFYKTCKPALLSENKTKEKRIQIGTVLSFGLNNCLFPNFRVMIFFIFLLTVVWRKFTKRIQG